MNKESSDNKLEENNNIIKSKTENEIEIKSGENKTDQIKTSELSIKEEWYYDKHIKGKGEPPKWFNKEKYQSISEQAKAQRELEQHLGSKKSKANRENKEEREEIYELKYPKGFPQHLKINERKNNDETIKIDPKYQQLIDEAKRLKITNEQFNYLHVESKYEEYKQQKEQQINELKKLGEKAKERITRINNWASNNLGEKQIVTLKGIADKAEVIELIEHFIEETRERAIKSPNQINKVMDIENYNEITKENLNKRVMDDRYRTTPSFREETTRLFKLYYDQESNN